MSPRSSSASEFSDSSEGQVLVRGVSNCQFILPHLSSREEATWIPPAPPWCKINVDGATVSTTHCSGVGIVIRDNAGRVTAVMSMKIPCLLGPLESEANKGNGGGGDFCMGYGSS
ncbi:hypothetical protein SO802_015336 [Lithocarpus litseifolius]|uniref:RNase H type-1 domain-containing protein n=1 Tax=Lithocarpus litseifolius TaxID=425828 RepID=A0AAW2CXJ4_9ROSI